MADKSVKTRIQHKREFETNWNLATNFVPLDGELIVYLQETDASTGELLTTQQGGQTVSVLTGLDRTTPMPVPRFKVGNGVSRLAELPFVNSQPVIVTVPRRPDFVDRVEASHTATEICDLISSGIPVFLSFAGTTGTTIMLPVYKALPDSGRVFFQTIVGISNAADGYGDRFDTYEITTEGVCELYDTLPVPEQAQKLKATIYLTLDYDGLNANGVPVTSNRYVDMYSLVSEISSGVRSVFLKYNSSYLLASVYNHNTLVFYTEVNGIYKRIFVTTSAAKYIATVEDLSLNNQVATAYLDLFRLKQNDSLLPGTQYRITDYQTITTQSNTRSAEHQFDIIVTADTPSTLNENARACLHEGDTYFAGCNLAAWELKYRLDNAEEDFEWCPTAQIPENIEFVWCTNDITKDTLVSFNIYCEYLDDRLGEQIFSMEANTPDEDVDLFASDIFTPGESFFAMPFTDLLDMSELHIAPKLYDDTPWQSGSYISVRVNGKERCTFDYMQLEAASSIDLLPILQSALLTAKGVIYYMKDEYDNEAPYDFKNIQFLRTEEEHHNTTNLDGDMYFYTFSLLYGRDVYDATVFHATTQNAQGVARGNTILSAIYTDGIGAQYLNNNVFIGSAIGPLSCPNYNRLGYNCSNNTFGSGCDANILGNGCSHNYVQDYGVGNILGDNCANNRLGVHSHDNIFGSNCNANELDTYNSSNSFGDGCCNNILGTGCDSNSVGTGCEFIAFVCGCGNHFSVDCHHLDLSINDISYSSFGSNCEYINIGGTGSLSHCVFDSGSKYITLLNDTPAVESIQVCSNVRGYSSVNPKILSNPDSYTTYVAGNSKTIYV
jgi:hypothetical protein